MANTVFILGAGASAKSGAPLMSTFLDVAESLMRSGKVESSKNDFELVFKGLHALQAVHSKSIMETQNIESVFAAFEMAQLLNRLDDLPPEEVQNLPNAMRRMIERTLEQTIDFPTRGSQVRPPSPFEELVSLVVDLNRENRYEGASVITFNYDVNPDFAFHKRSIPVDYCLGKSPSNAGIRLLKLHGSLNWIRCPNCKEIAPWNLQDFFRMHNWHNLPFQEAERSTVRLDISSQLKNFQHCAGEKTDVPMIIPPTWNKSKYHEQISSVWKTAALELSKAETIIVCGYSLTETDYFFRFLYALGTISPTIIKRFWVFDPDPAVEERFRNLLGPTVARRFKAFHENFDAALNIVREQLKVKTG